MKTVGVAGYCYCIWLMFSFLDIQHGSHKFKRADQLVQNNLDFSHVVGNTQAKEAFLGILQWLKNPNHFKN